MAPGPSNSRLSLTSATLATVSGVTRSRRRLVLELLERVGAAVEEGRVTAAQAQRLLGAVVLAASGHRPGHSRATWYRQRAIAEEIGLDEAYERVVPEPGRVPELPGVTPRSG
jgi:hypothetical protein